MSFFFERKILTIHERLFFFSPKTASRVSGEVSSSPSRARLKNVTNVLGQLLEDYDIRLRPDFGGKV